MVCDFKAVKLALKPLMDRLDHALMVNANDETGKVLLAGPLADRIVAIDDEPTTEVMARMIFSHLESEMRAGRAYRDELGVEYRLRTGVTLERIRVTETGSTWAEYSTM